jgi:prophage regulatory protein
MTNNHKLIRRPAVQEKTGLSRSTIYEKMKSGSFPTPVKLGPRAVGWVETEVDAWLEDRIAHHRGLK